MANLTRKLISELDALSIVNGEFVLIIHDGTGGKQIAVSKFLEFVLKALEKTGGSGSTPGSEEPKDPVEGVTTWIDTSDPENPCMKIYIQGKWVTLTTPSTGDMKAEIYDSEGKAIDMFSYVDTEVSTKVHGIPSGTIDELKQHLADGDSHVDQSNKGNWDALDRHSKDTSVHMDDDTASKVTTLTTHIAKTDIHVSGEEREHWEEAGEHVTDDAKHIEASLKTNWNAAASHAGNTEIHVSQELKDDWDSRIGENEMNEAINNMKSYSAGSGQGAGGHNNIYRGKNLGSSVTEDQWKAIASGEFTDLFIGDYWTISGVTYRIAAFDYYFGKGDTPVTKHHVTIVPDNQLGTAAMNSSGNTNTGYALSDMFKSNLTTHKNTIKNAFGSAHILTHRKCLSNAATSGLVTGYSWYDCDVDIMSEVNVYGSRIFGSEPDDGTKAHPIYSVDNAQYPLFAFRPDLIMDYTRKYYWLREVVDGSGFASVHYNGYCTSYSAGNSYGVRPAFSLIGD